MTEACFPADTCIAKAKAEPLLNQEEGEEDMSGTQFVCETVIRSLTLDAAPDHKPPQKKKILQCKYCHQLAAVALLFCSQTLAKNCPALQVVIPL